MAKVAITRYLPVTLRTVPASSDSTAGSWIESNFGKWPDHSTFCIWFSTSPIRQTKIVIPNIVRPSQVSRPGVRKA